MNLDIVNVLVYLAPMTAIWLLYAARRRHRHTTSARLLEEAQASGLTEPASLHPVIDPARCLGCGTCVTACPEGEILGLLHGKAVLVRPSACIGHGACKEACPQDAIRLVLGTARRGVEVPATNAEFETNVPGLFVAGEVTGMGLIRNAVSQGAQAMDAAARSAAARQEGDRLDVVVVGAGPAGLAASLRARELGLKFKTLEQDTLGGTIAHYPRGKIVMTTPIDLPGYGSVKLRETSKETLLGVWNDAVEKTGLSIEAGQRVRRIRRDPDGLVVETTTSTFKARAVVLCIGRRGSPRRLDVPGEDLEKVVYRLIDPEQYAGQRVMVVGGGDSALEAALTLSEQPGTQVCLTYRGDAFSRAKVANREGIENAAAQGKVAIMLAATPTAVLPDTVHVDLGVGVKEIANDIVIVCIGGELPSGFLRESGVDIEVRHGE
jgi:thioredoxin reductase/NAD-dependent dihydropyrimidine dehydrogenase PreA subunit